jgi:AcrR family transcriptional regulator
VNKTKRKIFETSMKLFAEKGYDATSIEEITSVVGVAKGTLYYHFSSKEEIFEFLVEEGVKLLKNSIEIKTEGLDNSLDKVRAVVLIEIKVLVKYENFITMVLSEIWGTSPRAKICQKYMFEYLEMVQNIVEEGIKKGEIVGSDPNVIVSGIFGFVCSSLIYKIRENKNIEVMELYKEIDKTFISKLQG